MIARVVSLETWCLPSILSVVLHPKCKASAREVVEQTYSKLFRPKVATDHSSEEITLCVLFDLTPRGKR